MKIEGRGIDLMEINSLAQVIEMVDRWCYCNLLLRCMPRCDVTHYTDIRIVSMDENEIHLLTNIGWWDEWGLVEKWAAEDRLYEAKAPTKKLLDESIPLDDRLRLVKWKQTHVKKTEKRNKNNQDSQSQEVQ